METKYYSIDEKFLGVPYKIGEADFKGADCIGIVILWFKEHGINFEYTDGKGMINKDWFYRTPRRFIDGVLKHGEIIKFSDLKKFDCLLLTPPTGHGIVANGFGVMIDDRHLLTSLPDRGSFVEMMNMFWKSAFWGGLRLHKVKEKGL